MVEIFLCNVLEIRWNLINHLQRKFMLQDQKQNTKMWLKQYKKCNKCYKIDNNNNNSNNKTTLNKKKRKKKKEKKKLYRLHLRMLPLWIADIMLHCQALITPCSVGNINVINQYFVLLYSAYIIIRRHKKLPSINAHVQ